MRNQQTIAISKTLSVHRKCIAEDLLQLLRSYIELPDGSFKSFVENCWRPRQTFLLHFLCLAPQQEWKEIFPRLWDELCFNLLKFFAQKGPAYSEQWLIGCLFVLFSLVETQPRSIPVKIPAELADRLVDFAENLSTTSAAASLHQTITPAAEDCLFCLRRLFVDREAQIQVVPYDQHFDELVYYMHRLDPSGQVPDRNLLYRTESLQLADFYIQRAAAGAESQIISNKSGHLNFDTVTDTYLEGLNAIDSTVLGSRLNNRNQSVDGIKEAVRDFNAQDCQKYASLHPHIFAIPTARCDQRMFAASHLTTQPISATEFIPRHDGGMPDLFAARPSTAAEEEEEEDEETASEVAANMELFDDQQFSDLDSPDEEGGNEFPAWIHLTPPARENDHEQQLAEDAEQNDVHYEIDEDEWALRGGLL